jgi:hypothetical protein
MVLIRRVHQGTAAQAVVDESPIGQVRARADHPAQGILRAVRATDHHLVHDPPFAVFGYQVQQHGLPQEKKRRPWAVSPGVTED